MLFNPIGMRGGLESSPASPCAIGRLTCRGAAVLRLAVLTIGWRPARLIKERDALRGHAQAGPREVEIHLRMVNSQPPGLDGVTIDMGFDAAVSLDRAPGGLRTKQRETSGPERIGTLLGASRSEPGVLGEGMRQALLRDSSYIPELRCASISQSFPAVHPRIPSTSSTPFTLP